MSFLRNKHSGWTHELKRTPFEDSPFASIIQNASKKLNDLFYAGAFGDVKVGDSGNFINQAFAPLGGLGNDIASGLGSIDKAVNELPGGWALPAAVAATVAAPYIAPAIAEGLGGATAAEGIAGGTATGTGLTAGAGGSTGLLSGGTVGSLVAPTTAGALGLSPAAEAAIAAGAGAELGSSAASFSPAGVGGLNAALPAAGSVGGAGMSAALPASVMVGDGTLGTTLGATYMASAPGQFALDALGNAIPASSVGVGGYAPSGTGLSDALKTANDARKAYSTANNLAKLINGIGSMGSSSVAKTSGQSASNGNLSNLASLLSGGAPQTNSFIGQIKMNQNPFLFTSPGQTEATQGTYDVSGSNLANALRKA